MSNKFKETDIKDQHYYFFDDIIDIKSFDPNNIKIDEEPYNNIPIYYIRYETIKDSKHVTINSVNALHLIFNIANGCFEEININRYLRLAPANENEEKIKKYEELWIKISYLISPTTKNSDGSVVRAVLREDNKYHPEDFLDECLYQLQMI